MITNPDLSSLPFDSWKTTGGILAYTSGWRMGQRHAQTGDPSDFSDERCRPLETERDSAANANPVGVLRGAFHAGYQAGYESVLNA